MTDKTLTSRREVLKDGILGLAAVAAVAAGVKAQAQGTGAATKTPPPKVKPTDPLAQALHYTEDATTAPSNLRKPNSFCHNCTFFQGTTDKGFAPCQVFQGKLVHADGWCSSWTAKT